MLLNQPARDLLVSVPENATIVAHDWLAYIIVTAGGGKVIYDGTPTLDYRQHGGNLIGANTGFMDRIMRLRKMLSGRFVAWNDVNLENLEHLRHIIQPDNLITLESFQNARRQGLIGRMAGLAESKVYRQTIAGNISLAVAACLNRL